MRTSPITQTRTEQFGLFAILESKRVVLPLKGVECEFADCGGVVEVGLSQIFRQENPRPLDCEYLFPLPANASVFSCVADINGRVIRAEVQERGAARKLVAEKKAAGFRTALVESERDNLFTLSLGNVQPDDLVVVRLKYFQALRAFDDTRSIEIPFCPGVRYIPGNPLLRSNRGKGVADDTDAVPDASRISPVRIDAGHPDAAYVDVFGTLDAGYVEVQSLASPSHVISTASSEGKLTVTLSAKDEVPDRDFVLRWTERNPDSVTPRAWMRAKGEDMFALMEVRAPKEVSAARTALDFYFLVDRSGSMAGAKWQKAVEALQSCVAVLGPDDRAMVTLFESSFRDFAEQPMPVRELFADREFQRLERMGTAGGTEMQPALQHVLDVARKNSHGRDKNLILITDAQIGNEPAILDLMKTMPEMAVHCFGIDIALNDALLLALSRQQGGTFHSLNPNDDIQAAVTKLGKTLRQQVLLDLKLSDGWECAEAKIPNLFAGQIVCLSAKATGQKPLALTARTASAEPVEFRFQAMTLAQEAPYLHWCMARIQRLLAESNDREAIALSTAANLLCRLTAFVAWDESEKVTVAQHELVQPVMELPTLMCRMVGGSAGAASADPVSLDELAICGLTAPAPQPLAKKSASFAPMQAIRRFIGGRTEFKIKDLKTVCDQLGGNDAAQYYTAIAAWFDYAATEERAARMAGLKQLIQTVNVCLELMEALGRVRSVRREELVNEVRLCHLEFRNLLQHWKGSTFEARDLGDLVRRVETECSSASTEELAVLATEIRGQAIEILKSFAESLLAKK